MMPVSKKRSSVILCAAITADGKLDGDYHSPAAASEFFSLLPGEVLLADSPPAGDAGQARFVIVAERDNLAQRLRGLGRVFCFGGPALFRRLFDASLVAEICLRVRPKIDGRNDAATLGGVPGEFFSASVECRLIKMEVLGSECLLHYRVRRGRAKRAAAA